MSEFWPVLGSIVLALEALLLAILQERPIKHVKVSSMEMVNFWTFLRLCFKKAWKGSWEKFDTFITVVVGIFIPIIIHFVPRWETALNSLVWEIPLAAFASLSVYRLLMSPYWIYRDKDLEAQKLADKLEGVKVEHEQSKRQHANKALDWGGEWKLAEDGFRPYRTSGVRAKCQYESTTKRNEWTFVGDDRINREDIEAWCMRAGALLLSTPGFHNHISDEIRACQDDKDRWLEYMKERHPLSDLLPLSSNSGYYMYQGHINNIAALSASECVKCASTALRFKQLW